MVVKELDRYLVNVLHDDDLLALIAIPPLIVERRVVTLGYQHLAGKVDLADSWSAQNPDSAHICLVDEFEILAVNALQIAQVLNLNFGGISMNLPSQRPIKSLTAEQRPVILKGPLFQGRKTGSKNGLLPLPPPKPQNHWASPKTPNLGVVVKELDRYLVNVLHDDDLLALIAIPPLIVERRVVNPSATSTWRAKWILPTPGARKIQTPRTSAWSMNLRFWR